MAHQDDNKEDEQQGAQPGAQQGAQQPTQQGTQPQGFQERLRRNVTKLQQDGQKVQVLGRIQNGKLEIDQDSLKELEQKYPNATMAFIALNSPFDPAPCADE
jgi:hypothetical protein